MDHRHYNQPRGGYNNNNYNNNNNNYNNYDNYNNNFNNRGTHLNSYAPPPPRGIMNNNRHSTMPPPPPPHPPLPPKKATTAAIPSALEKTSSVNNADASPPPHKAVTAATPVVGTSPKPLETSSGNNPDVSPPKAAAAATPGVGTVKGTSTLAAAAAGVGDVSSTNVVQQQQQQPSRLRTDDPASIQGLPGALVPPSVPDMPTEATSRGGMTLVGRFNQAAGIVAHNGNQLVSISCLSILYLKCLSTNIIFAYEHTSYRTTRKLAVSVPTTSSKTTLTALTLPS